MSERLAVLDAFSQGHGGAFTLERRSPTLDGSVPVRAAQACVPLLEGNAFGLQLVARSPLLIERRLGRTPKVTTISGPSIETLHAAALPRLRAQGLVSARWAAAFERSVVHVSRGAIRLFTGLLVRAPADAWLRVSSTANRRSAAYEIDEVFIAPEDGLVPLVITLRADGDLRLEGEIATVAEVRPGVAIERRTLADEPELGRAHARFYDAEYFATKKGETTRKYKREVVRLPRADADGSTEIVDAGPVEWERRVSDKCITNDHVTPVARTPGVTSVVFRALLDFSATWDGMSVVLEYDRAELARHGRALERAWTDLYGASFMEKHRGAVWYLTKYFTPHPPGEPHFFVKPWSFVRTSAGWSSLVEGCHGAGWDVLRGVIATDVFHAAPAVFLLRAPRIRIRAGEPLFSLLPFPRSAPRALETVTWT